MKKSLLFSFLLSLALVVLKAQDNCPAYWTDIQKFKQQDSAQMPPKGAILLIGSSSFTMWKDAGKYFPGYTIVNRAFGGSHLTDVIRYVYDVVLPYAPRQVIVYCGENDLAASDTLEAADVVLRFKTLFGIIRQNLPQTTVHFVSMKPSPSRLRLLPKFVAANNSIRSFLRKQKHAGFINVYNAMLENGAPRAELFGDDNLHMNPDGYRIWQRIMLPYLTKE